MLTAEEKNQRKLARETMSSEEKAKKAEENRLKKEKALKRQEERERKYREEEEKKRKCFESEIDEKIRQDYEEYYLMLGREVQDCYSIYWGGGKQKVMEKYEDVKKILSDNVLKRLLMILQYRKEWFEEVSDQTDFGEVKEFVVEELLEAILKKHIHDTEVLKSILKENIKRIAEPDFKTKSMVLFTSMIEHYTLEYKKQTYEELLVILSKKKSKKDMEMYGKICERHRLYMEKTKIEPPDEQKLWNEFVQYLKDENNALLEIISACERGDKDTNGYKIPGVNIILEGSYGKN